ncbi:hypothetical protein [Methylobacterium sp. Leaf86]|uniref:hypothetical protein n=1 Tax=Methylobacterium sp. Leaf86 TaxID=1736242 RepID=UPI0012E9098E|nr:hypothetical protein [Methylobacterium sp. Leaf86]
MKYMVPAITDTVVLTCQNNDFVDPHYLKTGREGVRKEIEGIIHLFSLIKESMRSVHSQTYDVLYDAGIKPYDIIDFCSVLSNACSSLDLSSVPERIPRGRSEIHADFITEYLAGAFEILVGRPAAVTTKDGVAGGKFIGLVADIFAAASVGASAEGCARRAIRKRKALKSGPKTPFESDPDPS